MPYNTTGDSNNNNMPAIWLLNGEVVRTNQWGCNCRGIGADGGCGELDIAEVIGDQPDTHCTTTFYSFKDSSGAGGYFDRPVDMIVNFVVVFNASGSGTITIIKQQDSDWPNFGNSIQNLQVNSWLQNATPTINVTLEYPYNNTQCITATTVVPRKAPSTSDTAQGFVWMWLVVGFMLVIFYI